MEKKRRRVESRGAGGRASESHRNPCSSPAAGEARERLLSGGAGAAAGEVRERLLHFIIDLYSICALLQPACLRNRL
jgi:hypothetical protein